MARIDDMEVWFHVYCAACKYRNLEEKMDPCNDCLAHPMNRNSRRPIRFEEVEVVKEENQNE